MIRPVMILGLLFCVGCGPPPMLVKWISAAHPDVLFSATCADSFVALTIDDGPTPEWTPGILEQLRRHDASATFFLMGSRVEGNESIVRRIVEDGHEIGHHMMTARPSITLPPAEFGRRFAEADSILTSFGPVQWMRPASGWFTDGMRRIVENRGYRMALGSIYPNDAMNPFSSYQAHYVLRYIEPGDVIILHDGLGPRTRAPAALEKILPKLRSRGYKVVTLSELVETCEGPAG